MAEETPAAAKKETLNLLSSFKAGQADNSKQLRYPNIAFDTHHDYVRFSFWKYTGPFKTNRSTTTIAADGEEAETSYDSLTGAQTYNKYNSVQYEAYQGAPVIMMYMPEDISTGYGTDWSGKTFTNTAADVLATAGSLNQGQGGAAAAAVKSMINRAARGGATMGAESLSGLINNMPGGLGGAGVSTEDVLQGVAGVVLNPNTELMFTGFNLRNFTLKFKMSPRNPAESAIIKQIIGNFKHVSLPTLGATADSQLDFSNNFLKGFSKEPAEGEGTDGQPAADGLDGQSNANYIGVPGLCQVTFMQGGKPNPNLPLWKVAAITDVSVNYTPDGTYATYADGTPVSYELSLSFVETKLIFNQDINRKATGASF
mgnify:CR=1 FL=1